MANKSGGLLIKVAIVIAVIGAVFFALDTWRKKSGEQVAMPGSETPAGSLSREEAERIGREIGTRIGTEIGTQIGREVAAQMLAERAAEVEAKKAVAKPAPIEPEPATPAEAVAQPAPMEPEPASSAEAVAAVEADAATPSEPAESSPAPPRRRSGDGAWWTRSRSSDPDALVLEHVGDFRSTDGQIHGITLIFNGRFDSQTDFSFLSPPRGWERGAKPGLIYLPRIPAGRYTVTIKAGFKDADGKTVKQDVSGPITVR